MNEPLIDPDSGLPLPHPQNLPFPAGFQPETAAISAALQSMILSASGWRKVFAASGNEESREETVQPSDLVLCAAMAEVFAAFLKENSKVQPLRVAVGMDSRFTGPVMADVMTRIFLARGLEVEYLGITAAPEIMAHVQVSSNLSGFAYISASHNPIGHNGVKFGLEDGGVIGGFGSASLITSFRSLCGDLAKLTDLVRKANEVPTGDLLAVYQALPGNRRASRDSYRRLSLEVFTLQSDKNRQEELLRPLRGLISSSQLGVLAEFNGSARTLTIDKAFLEDLGVKVKTVNDQPRQITHRIVPEGRSLDLCREELLKARQTDPGFVLGYVPDCDGDRGNLVYYNHRTGQVDILEAQEVFALCVLSELAGLAYFGALTWDEENYPEQRVAVACNDPTSLRVDRIAAAFGAAVFRAEVGEANVVNLARNLRTQDWVVRILGEGSNGGNITFPGSVRDPLSTLGSLLKLLSLRSTADKPGLFEIWCRRSGQAEKYQPDFTLADIMATLPAFITTSAYEDRAILKIRSQNHAQLKAAYEKHFVTSGWKENAAFLRDELGIYAWEEINYEGMEERRGFGPPFRSGRETGGLKILLKDKKGQAVGYIWMRGSGTEPVFRVLADIEGSDPFKEEWLLNWHVSMIRKVD